MMIKTNKGDKSILICDLETTSLEVNEAIIRVFGAYDPYEDAYYIYRWTNENIAKIMRLFATHKFIITFNGTKYDLPIMKRHGIPTDFKHIDLYQVYKYKRTNLLRTGGFTSYGLKALVLQLGLDEVGKGDIDYEVFKKETWTKIEQEQIIKYLKQDLLSTYKLWDYTDNKLDFLKKYLKQNDQENYKHLTTNLDTYTYKVISNEAGIQELYDENPAEKSYPLPYMTTPRKPYANGRIILLQFNHLFAHTLIQFNLLSHNCKCCMGNEGKYHGKNIYNVKGYYCQRRIGRIEKYLKDLLIRAENNQEDKIISQIIYAHLYDVITNGVYYSTYYSVAPNDAISLIKQMSKVIIDKFEAEGYYVLYMDNDDVFIQLKENQDVKGLLEAKENIMNLLKSRMTYPSETFKLTNNDEISYIQFFNKGSEKNKVFMYKGEYVYINKRGEVFSKGVNNEDINSALKNRNKILNEETQ